MSCNHPSLRFDQGTFYLRCEHCEFAMVAITRRPDGSLTFDHKRIGEEVSNPVMIPGEGNHSKV